MNDHWCFDDDDDDDDDDGNNHWSTMICFSIKRLQVHIIIYIAI